MEKKINNWMDHLGEWNFSAGRFDFSGGLGLLFEDTDKEITLTTEEFYSLVHPDDRGRMRNAHEKHKGDRKPYFIDYQIKTFDGVYLMVHQHCLPVMHRKRYLYSTGILYNLRNAEVMENQISIINQYLEGKIQENTRELNRQKQFIQQIFNYLPGIFYVFNIQGQLKLWNRNFQKMLGRNDMEMRDLTINDRVCEIDRPLIEDVVNRCKKDGYVKAMGNLLSSDKGEIPFCFTGSRVDIGSESFIVATGFHMDERG